MNGKLKVRRSDYYAVSSVLSPLTDIKQGPWVSNESRHLRRDIHYKIATTNTLGKIIPWKDEESH